MGTRTIWQDRVRRKRDGTPDKSTTPSQDQDDASTPSRNVIWNEEIEKLQIKAEELPRLWPPRPPSTEKNFVRVSVQKVKNVPEVNKCQPCRTPKRHSLSSPVHVDLLESSGPHYTKEGEVIPYTLLGTYEEFYKEATKRGALSASMPKPHGDLERIDTPSVKYEKKKRRRHCRDSESNSLRNWYNKMKERKNQQGYISKLLQKAPEDLAMNQSDNYRAIQEQRYLIDRTISKVDYGKGYRTGSEFWFQQEHIGDDQKGLHMTLTQTQKGYPPPIEHVGLSQIVKFEKGCNWTENENLYVSYPWHKSEFLNQRMKQLQPYIDEIDSWKPDFDALQIVGSNKPYKSNLDAKQDASDVLDAALEGSERQGEITPVPTDVSEAESDQSQELLQSSSVVEKSNPVLGPSLLIGQQAARWTGDNTSKKDKVAIQTLIDFETFSEDRVTSYLELINDGTTSVYYDWKKITKENPFGHVQSTTTTTTQQRFYFNNSQDVILPGATLKFPFVFKSPNAGVFTEQWKFDTRPVLCGGATILVTLRGVALQRDKFKVQREQLEKELLSKQANQVVSYLLYELVRGIRTPRRPCSPVDTYITEEEIFSRNNPGFQYHHELVAQLKGIYGQLFNEGIRAENVWSLSIDDLRESILQLNNEEEGKKEMLLHQMNSLIAKLTYTHSAPVQQNLHLFGHQILMETVDNIVNQDLLLRHRMGLPGKDKAGQVTETEILGKSSGAAGAQTKTDSGKDKFKESTKDMKTTKTLVKSDSKGKSTPTSRKTSAKISTSTPVPANLPGEKTESDNQGTQLSSTDTAPSVVRSGDELAAAEKMYRDSFRTQVYEMLGDMADRMDSIFSALTEQTRLPVAFSSPW